MIRDERPRSLLTYARATFESVRRANMATSRRRTLTWALVAMLALAEACDLATTIFGLTRGGVAEANPGFVAFASSPLGLIVMVTVKVLGTGFLGWLLVRLPLRAGALACALAWYPAVSNLLLLTSGR